jgi:hypothetical protein
MVNEDRPETDECPEERAYRALAGTVVSDPAFVARLGHADFLCRLLYNAAIDPRVPFSDGFAYRYQLAEARRAGVAEPTPPVSSKTYLPVPTTYGLGPELTALCDRFPALRLFPRTMLDNAVAEGCRARARHVADCGLAKAAGRPMPKLRFRRADADWSVSTENFWLLRIGTDHAQKPSKRAPSATTLRNRARRAALKAAREQAWAAEKRRCGWNEAKCEAGLGRRADRHRRDRELQQALQVWTAEERAERRVRRDSPKATVGHTRMKIDVAGLGRVRIDLGGAIPEGAEKVRLTLVKPAWAGAKVSCRVTFSVPCENRDAALLENGRRLHEALRHLPADATRLQARNAAIAASLLVRGEDLGSANPSCDDRGAATPPVRMPRLDLQAMKRAQVRLARKDEARKKAGGDRRRSKAAERERATLARIGERSTNRQRTRAHQDAARLMRDAPVLVATDPLRMVKPLLAKDGPADRRARRLAGEPIQALRGFSLRERRERAMRRNLLATSLATRIRRLIELGERTGTIVCMPGHEGTTAGCPDCPRVVSKGLGERWHRCSCGLVLPRDQASAIETVGRALLRFRTGPDPDGAIAAGIAKREAERAKDTARRERLSERSLAAAQRRRATKDDAGDSPGHQGVVFPGPAAPAAKRVRGQGRNVRRSPGQAAGISN